MKTEEMIAVMQAHLRGEEIECQSKYDTKTWTKAPTPGWNFLGFKYRVRPKPCEHWVVIYPDGSVRPCESKKEANYQVSCVKEFYPTARAALMREVL